MSFKDVLPKAEGLNVALQLLNYLGSHPEDIESQALAAWLKSAQRIAGLGEPAASDTRLQELVVRDRTSIVYLPPLPFPPSPPFTGSDFSAVYWNDPIRVVQRTEHVGSSYGVWAIAATPHIGSYVRRM